MENLGNDEKAKTRKELGLPENKKIIVLQGSGINVDRGGEEVVQAMEFLNDAVLLIIGSGDVIDALKDVNAQGILVMNIEKMIL